MHKRLFTALALTLALAVYASAQNANTSTTPPTRARTSTQKKANQTATTDAGAQTQDEAAGKTPAQGKRTAGNNASSSKDVMAAFNALIEGIRRADVGAVTSVYWRSPQLVLFNNNGTVTRGWEQMKTNRESSYPNLKDVKLEVRDVRVQMLGRDGAVVTCLWTQSQTYKGTPETATGRMTLVFRRVGTAWKAVHLHTSPDAPDPSRVLPSEQATPTPSPTPKVRP